MGMEILFTLISRQNRSATPNVNVVLIYVKYTLLKVKFILLYVKFIRHEIQINITQ